MIREVSHVCWPPNPYHRYNKDCHHKNSTYRKTKTIVIVLKVNSLVLQYSSCIAQSVEHLTQEPVVPGSIPIPATYFRFSFP